MKNLFFLWGMLVLLIGFTVGCNTSDQQSDQLQELVKSTLLLSEEVQSLNYDLLLIGRIEINGKNKVPFLQEHIDGTANQLIKTAEILQQKIDGKTKTDRMFKKQVEMNDLLLALSRGIVNKTIEDMKDKKENSNVEKLYDEWTKIIKRIDDNRKKIKLLAGVEVE